MDSPRKLYDENASSWVRNAPLSLSDFTSRPAVLRLCQPVTGLRVLDLGCGEGYCTRQLRQMGAGEVLGIDLSEGMIEAARREEERAPLGIRYEAGDAGDLAVLTARLGDSLAPGTFDLVLSVFMFNYMGLCDTRRCLAQVLPLLRPTGRFIFAVPHPCLPWLRRAEPPFYFTVGDSGYISGRDQRFPGRIWKRDGSHLEVQLVHKTFTDYFDALRDAGFTSLPILHELYVTPEILAQDPLFFGPLLDIPLHLAFSISR